MQKRQLMERKPPVELTPERKLAYIEHLRRHGRFYSAAQAVGIAESTAVDHRRVDPEFKRLCDEAKQTWIDEVLVAEAVRRAVEGVEEPIIGGKFRDEVVATKVVYSDHMLSLQLRAHRAEYREGAGAAGAGSGGGSTSVMFIPAAAPKTADEWEAEFGEAAKGQTGRGT